MSYPSLEQYNEAFQAPQIALIDPELKRGSIATTGLGLPLALCGGFALTYTINSGSKKYAVRCFHKHSNALEKRYSSISSRLKSLKSQYFVDFEFQSNGVRVSGNTFPVVKMAWATGTTLGQYLEQNYKNPNQLKELSQSLRNLANFLEKQGIAHGDIQPGNVMVTDAGKTVQLIDYDGIYLDDLKNLGSAELGHRNFQHPRRSNSSWDSSLDRFSFIGIDLALRVLAVNPELWNKTQSDGDSILFKANDFADPSQSIIFAELSSKQAFADEVRNLTAICLSEFNKTPTLEDFLLKKNIPQIAVLSQPIAVKPLTYLSAFTVLDADDYNRCLSFVGDKVELIGLIVEVSSKNTRHGKPYIFINFGPWQGKIVKVNIWSEGLEVLNKKPNESWVGKWISVVGLMEPPYVKKKYRYSHLAISVTQSGQLHEITEKDAKFRLASITSQSIGNTKSSNEKILVGLRSGDKSQSYTHTQSTRTASAPKSRNDAILQKMKAGQSTVAGATRGSTKIPAAKSSSTNCFVATAVYGIDAAETNVLREWRDLYLMTNKSGRFMVYVYYFISPYLLKLIKKDSLAERGIRVCLDYFISKIKIN